MSWIGKALGVVGKIGGIASKFAGAGGVIGKIAGGISKAASLVTSAKAAPWIAGAAAIGTALYKSGIADKLTGGGATRFVKKVSNFFNPYKGQTVDGASGAAQRVGQSYTGQVSQMVRR